VLSSGVLLNCKGWITKLVTALHKGRVTEYVMRLGNMYGYSDGNTMLA